MAKNMGKSSGGARRGVKRGGVVAKKTSSKYLVRVADWKKLPKRSIRGSADVSGSMLWTGDEKPAKVFTVRNLLKGTDQLQPVDKDSSELVRRPAVGLSMACGMMQGAREALRCVPVLEDGHRAAKAFNKTGLPAAVKAFADVPDLASSIAYLNIMDEEAGERTLAGTTKALETVMAHLGDADTADERMKSYARQLDFAARIVGDACAKMELTALLSNIKTYGKLVADPAKQPKDLQKWLRSPADEKLFVKSLAKALLERTQAKKARKGAFDESESSGPAASSGGSDASSDAEKKSGSDDSSSSSSSGDRKRKAKKAGKKEKKGQKASKDAKPSKAAKKASKAAKGEKAKTPPSSSDSDDSDAKRKQEEKRRRKEAEKTERVKAEAVEATYLLWSKALVQEFVSEMDSAMQEVGRDDAGGIFPVAVIKTLREKVPADVLATHPALAARLAAIEDKEDAPSGEARRVLRMLSALGTDVETFYDGQTGGGASAASASKKEA